MKNWSIALLTGMTLGALALPAAAHGPSRQKADESVVIDAPADKVWALVGDFNGLPKWVPPVASSAATAGNGVGSERTLTIKNGEVLKESLVAYDPATMTLRYKIVEPNHKVLPVNTYSSSISVTADGPNRSTVNWRGAFYRAYMNNDPPPELNDDAALKAVTGLYQASLANLKKVAENTK